MEAAWRGRAEFKPQPKWPRTGSLSLASFEGLTNEITFSSCVHEHCLFISTLPLLRPSPFIYAYLERAGVKIRPFIEATA